MKTRAPRSLLPDRDSPALKQPSRASTESCSDKRAAQESQLAAHGNGPQTRTQAKLLASRTLRSAHLPLQPRVLLWLPWPCFNSSKTQRALSELHTLHLLCSLPGNAFPCPLPPPHCTHTLTLTADLTSSRKASLNCLCSEGSRHPPRQPSLDVCVFHRLASPLACQLGEGRALILGPGTVAGPSWLLHEHCLMTE